MRKYLFGLVVCLCLFSSCKESIEEDARTAANLTKESIIFRQNQNFERAEKSFMQSQSIINKYRKRTDYADFEIMYNKFLLESVEE